MQYFVRTVEKYKESIKVFAEEIPCSNRNNATGEAKRRVLESDPSRMLQADACFRNRDEVRTTYRCWINNRGEFHESALI